MNFLLVDRSKSRFAAYVEGLVSVIGHADRASPLRDYCLGLIMPCERKSVEPMAAVTAPDRTAAQHQSLLHLVGQSPWSDEKVLTKAGEMVLPSIESQGPIEAWIIDDTGFPKKGEHSVGVARQYCGQLGKRENCQVAVSLSLANHHASLPVAWRLYLPKEWAANHERRRKAGVPDEIDFKTKPEIALEQIGAALKAGLSRGVVLMDAAYGCNTDLRTGISALALTYVAGILPNTTVWTPGMGPLPPKKRSGCGQRPKRLRRDHEHKPISVEELALGLPKRSWRRIKWREGTAEHLLALCSGSDISKDEAGVASTTTPRCASPPTDFWSPRGRGFPPQDLVTPLGSKNLPFPKVIDPEAPPPRTDRHVPNSIATMRRRLIIALVSILSRCPCCATPLGKGSRGRKKL